MDLTSAELTLLGLVIEQPRHGYDLEQVIEQRGIRQWTDIGFSSIYYLLAKLHKRGLIDTDDADTGTKSRRVFRATEEGVQVAATATHSVISDLHTVQHPFLVGLANLPLLSKPDYDQGLNSRLAQVEARITSVSNTALLQAPLPRPAREIFSYALCLLEAERAWLAERTEVSDD